MIGLTLAQVADVVGGDLDDPRDADRRVDGVVIDSRAVASSELFVALPGARTDGHDHVASAVAAGAGGYLRSADREVIDAAGQPVRGGIAVDDPADALRGLGMWVRDEVAPTVVAVTGSNGKTTTKDLVAAAVGAGRSVIATRGSQNNELGLPLTCCRLEPSTQVLVAELGMRGRGQIAELAVPLRPDVAVVTNVAGVHLELLGSIEAIAAAKAELVESLGPGGTAVLNADDERVLAMAATARDRGADVWTFGRGEEPPEADVHLRAVDVHLDDEARATFTLLDEGAARPVHLRIAGLHYVGNALAAYAAARLCGVDPVLAVAGLQTAQVSRWRMQILVGPDGLRVVNDAYNANPASTAAALSTLVALRTPGRRVAVLGHMAEIGESSEAEHARVGALTASLGLDGLVVVGPAAAAIADGARGEGFAGPLGVHLATDVEAAAALVSGMVRPDDVVLVKASRSAGLERVAEALAPDASQETA